jgi:hypothetical protein
VNDVASNICYPIPTRGLHSSTLKLNVSAFYGTGVYYGVIYWVFRSYYGVLGGVRNGSG